MYSGRRFKTKEYNYWILKTIGELRRQPKFNEKKYSCEIRVPWWSHHTGADVSNYEKAILDIFGKTKAALTPDDKHCIDLRIRYVVKTDSEKIEVEFLDVTAEFEAMEAYALKMKDSNQKLK